MKNRLYTILGIITTILIISPIILLVFIPFRKIAILLILVILLAVFYLVFFFQNKIIDYAEIKIEDNDQLNKLDREFCLGSCGIGWTIGLAMLIPGLFKLEEHYSYDLFAILGLIVLIITSLLWYWGYFPRYIIARRKIKIKPLIEPKNDKDSSLIKE